MPTPGIVSSRRHASLSFATLCSSALSSRWVLLISLERVHNICSNRCSRGDIFGSPPSRISTTRLSRARLLFGTAIPDSSRNARIWLFCPTCSRTTRSRGEYQQSSRLPGWSVVANQALLWLDRARRLRESTVTYVKRDPLLASIRGDPRYEAFLKKMNLPE